MKWTNKGHEFADYESYYRQLSTIYLYGAYPGADDLYKMTDGFLSRFPAPSEHIKIKFVDRDETKQAAPYLSREVISPQRLAETFCQDGTGIVVLCVGEESMPELICRLSANPRFVRKKNLFTAYEFRRYFSVPIWYKYRQLFLWTVDIFAHSRCNLRCKGCLVMTSRRKNMRQQEPEQFIRYVDAFFSKVDYIDDLPIGIGDGFLYEHYPQILDYIRQHYAPRLNSISVVTNGTILPGNEMLDAFARNRVRVIVDDYRGNVPLCRQNYAKVVEALRRSGISYLEAPRNSWWDIRLGAADRSRETAQALTAQMDRCTCGVAGFPYWGISGNKLYRCLMSALADEFQMVRETENDYLDLPAAGKAEIMEFIIGYTDKGYLSACTKCGFDENKTIPAAVQIGREECV